MRPLEKFRFNWNLIYTSFNSSQSIQFPTSNRHFSTTEPSAMAEVNVRSIEDRFSDNNRHDAPPWHIYRRSVMRFTWGKTLVEVRKQNCFLSHKSALICVLFGRFLFENASSRWYVDFCEVPIVLEVRLATVSCENDVNYSFRECFVTLKYSVQ